MSCAQTEPAIITHKVCPLAAAYPQQHNSDCLGEVCACYVKIVKRRSIRIGDITFDDPKHIYSYRGCGLVTHVPWELKKRKEKPKNVKARLKEAQ